MIKIRTNLFIFSMLFSGLIYGQKRIVSLEQKNITNSVEIKHIDSLVNSIRLENTLQIINIDSISFSGKFNYQEVYNIKVYLKKKKIVRISLIPFFVSMGHSYSTGHSNIEYFINKDHLIFVSEQYIDNSRTGSCGLREINNKLYYKENTLLGTSEKDKCYNTPIEIDWLNVIFEKSYTLSKEKIR